MSRVRRDKNSQRTKWLLVFVAVCIVGIIFLAGKGRFNVPMSSATVTSALAPFQRAISWAGYKVNNVTSTIWEIVTVYHQNEMLKNEVVQLRQQNLHASEYEAENMRLHQLLQYKQESKQFDLLPAQVIGRESDTWTSMIVVNRGSSDGIVKNMPVVTEKGLVGVVTEVTPYASKVQMILDPRCAVGTLVQRPASRVAGLLQGNPDDAMCPKMINIPKNSDVVVGDTIFTSGFGGIYPKGIMVGKVKEIRNDGGGLLETAILETFVDFQKLEDVMIITASREAPPQKLVTPAQTPGTETDAEGNPLKGKAD